MPMDTLAADALNRRDSQRILAQMIGKEVANAQRPRVDTLRPGPQPTTITNINTTNVTETAAPTTRITSPSATTPSPRTVPPVRPENNSGNTTQPPRRPPVPPNK